MEISWLPYLKNTLLIISVGLFPILRFLQRSFHPSLESSSRNLGEASERRPVTRLLPGYVILFSLAEIPAVCGLVLLFLGSSVKTLFLMVGLSLIYLAFMTPPRELFHQSPRPL